MLQKLVSHNADLRRLVQKGYAVTVDSSYLVIRDIPYLDATGELQRGAIVTKLEFIDDARVTQNDHQIWFAGTVPHNIDGTPVPNLGGGPVRVTLSNACSDVVVQRSFSNKPRATGKFPDFFEKIESYVGIISGPAIERHNVHPYTFRVVEPEATPSVFRFRDTLSSLAEITDLSAKLTDDVIAIIGLGGTGAFVLDFLVRTPVREIRGFDGDAFHVHNAFRSPGAVNEQEFGEKKAVVYKARYDNFRNGISTRPTVIDASSEDELAGVTFVFVCVDKGPARAAIFAVLLAQGLPFIDVGMGLNRTRGAIGGMLRVTCHQPSVTPDVRKRAPLTDAPDDIYRNNIQISELNALNACLAVIRYKQLRGFYDDEVATSDILFGISDLGIAKA